APAAVQFSKTTSPTIRRSLIGAAPAGTIVTRSFAKSSLVHQILTPDDRLQKSPSTNWRSLPPATEHPEAMWEQTPIRTRVEKYEKSSTIEYSPISKYSGWRILTCGETIGLTSIPRGPAPDRRERCRRSRTAA